MIRGIGGVLSLTYAQTLNGYGAMFSSVAAISDVSFKH